MKFHKFGNKSNEIVILLHGVLTPWQIWQEQIEYLSDKYFVIAVALDAHTEEEASEFVSVCDEAKKIEKYIIENYGNRVLSLCGLSMGGVIANKIFCNEKLQIKYLILDGAPIVPTNILLTKIMTSSYLNIINKTKERDKKVLTNFKKQFLPEKYLASYLKLADTISEFSIKNIVMSVTHGDLCFCDNIHNTKILYMHGTKMNEILSRKSAKFIKRQYTESVIKCFNGYGHGELIIYKAEKWIEVFDSFIKAVDRVTVNV